MQKFLATFTVCTLIVFSGCHQNTDTFQISDLKLVEVAHSELLWTGVAVSKGDRIFVNYPRWSPNTKISVAEVNKSGNITAYPDLSWNEWNQDSTPQDHFICVQSVYVDRENYLWILDPANPFFQGVIEGGAKLVKVDLKSDKIIKKFHFDSEVTPANSYLNDIRIDTNNDVAYMTDSGLGAIIALNLKTGVSRRLLSNHHSTKAEDITLRVEDVEVKFQVHSDGLALDEKGAYLYYQALTGRSLYRIKTQYLNDHSLSEKELGNYVEFVGNSGASDAIIFGPGEYVYLSSIEHNAIRRIRFGETVQTVVQDSLLKWPDSFSLTPDGILYVTTSQIHLGAAVTEPYQIFKLEAGKEN